LTEELLDVKGYEGKSVLITGGAGCIGSNLVRGLLRTNTQKITVIDDLSSAKLWNLNKDPKVQFIRTSILDEEGLKLAFSSRPDLVFHLAAHFANQNSVDHPETDLQVNGLGTLRLLEYARMTNVSRFVFASSGCSVYGSDAPLPLKEDFVSLHLDTPYQITKLLGELYCNFYYNYYRLETVCCRFFNVFGPGELPGKYRNVIPNFAMLALHKQPLPVMGTGQETRDFTYVEDIVDALLRSGLVKQAAGEAFNLASGIETKVIDLASMINRLTDNPAGVKFIEKRDWDKTSRRRASIDKARSLIGYNPRVSVPEGLPSVIEWFKQHMTEIEEASAEEKGIERNQSKDLTPFIPLQSG
jgi:UDP-glucose 4-epimerase